MSDVRLMTVDPGHFHAALVQKEMYPGVAPRVDVYAPLGPDLYEHLKRIDAFNRRADEPDDVGRRRPRVARTTSSGCCASGRATSSCSPAATAAKIDRDRGVGQGRPERAGGQAVDPEVRRISPKLEATLAEADRAGVVAYDIMTERFEVTSILQRALVNDPAVFGEHAAGHARTIPRVYMESVHYLMKLVAGAPNIRPAWFFDNDAAGRRAERRRHAPRRSGAVDAVSRTRRSTTGATSRCWRRSAGRRSIPRGGFPARHRRAAAFPPRFARAVKDGTLEYFCNTLVSYTLRGVHTKLNVIWDWEPAPRIRRHALRVLQGLARQGRGAADAGRQAPSGALRRPGERRPSAARCWPRSARASRRCRRTSGRRRWRSGAARSTSPFPTRSASATRRTSRR